MDVGADLPITYHAPGNPSERVVVVPRGRRSDDRCHCEPGHARRRPDRRDADVPDRHLHTRGVRRRAGGGRRCGARPGILLDQVARVGAGGGHGHVEGRRPVMPSPCCGTRRPGTASTGWASSRAAAIRPTTPTTAGRIREPPSTAGCVSTAISFTLGRCRRVATPWPSPSTTRTEGSRAPTSWSAERRRHAGASLCRMRVPDHLAGGPGELVAIDLPQGEAWLEVVADLWWRGVAFLPLDGRLSPTEREALLARARPTTLLERLGETAFPGTPVRPEIGIVVATSGTGRRAAPRRALAPRRARGRAGIGGRPRRRRGHAVDLVPHPRACRRPPRPAARGHPRIAGDRARPVRSRGRRGQRRWRGLRLVGAGDARAHAGCRCAPDRPHDAGGRRRAGPGDRRSGPRARCARGGHVRYDRDLRWCGL